MSDLVPYFVLFAILIVVVSWNAINRPTPPDRDHLTNTDERCIRLRMRQEDARRRMRRLGIKTLLEGKRGWRKVVEMGELPKADKVTSILRGRK